MEDEKLNVVGDDGICTKINRYLHRYHTIDENLIKSIINNYLWFSDPSKFNDPYDCNLCLKSESSYDDILTYLNEENKKYHKDDNFITKRALELYENPDERLQLLKVADQQAIDNLGVCCFSQKDNALLMWSHYGDKHRGICLTFDISQDTELFKNILYNVEYPTTYPIYNWPNDRGTFKSKRFLVATKSKEWEYEDEIRIIRCDSNIPFRGEVEFNKNAFVAIKFGYKCAKYDLIAINSLLSSIEGYEHVKFYQGKLTQLAYPGYYHSDYQCIKKLMVHNIFFLCGNH